MPSLPKYPGTSSSAVEAMLEQLATVGWPVYAHDEPDRYVVALDDSLRFEIEYEKYQKTWGIKGYDAGQIRHLLTAGDSVAIRAALAKAAKAHGYDLSAVPTTARLSSSTPVSNRLSLVHLCGHSAVLAVFDPYFDDRAVANLAVLCNMGLRLASDVRVILTSKTARRLSPAVVIDFAAERSANLDTRVSASDKEHRRFLLLEGGKSLVLGCSLNDLTKNEAAHTEPSGPDQAFFEDQWACASNA